jgi:chromosomal replication initiation ATPase DnaA
MDTTELYEMREQVRGILGKLDRMLAGEPSNEPDEVVRGVVAGLWGVGLADMDSLARHGSVSEARQVVMTVLMEECGYSAARAAKVFGKGRSVAFYSRDCVLAEREHYPAFCRRYNQVVAGVKDAMVSKL